MANASRDENFVPTILGALNTDGTTVAKITAAPDTHFLDVKDSSDGSDHGGDVALRDDNYVTTLIAVSEADGSTPVVLYVDSSGNLLIDSN
jgi:hypothetical protein